MLCKDASHFKDVLWSEVYCFGSGTHAELMTRISISHLQVLNRILDFVGVQDAPQVSNTSLASSTGFKGAYNLTFEDELAHSVVREYYDTATEDLRTLLSVVKFPQENLWLKGFPLQE